MKNYRIGIFGLGTVATGVTKILKEQSHIYAEKFAVSFEIVQVVVHNLDKKRDPKTSGLTISDDPKTILDNPDIDIVIELVGGKTAAKTIIEKSLKAKKTRDHSQQRPDRQSRTQIKSIGKRKSCWSLL